MGRVLPGAMAALLALLLFSVGVTSGYLWQASPLDLGPWAFAGMLTLMSGLVPAAAYQWGVGDGTERGRAQGFAAGQASAARSLNDSLYEEQVRLKTAGITGVVWHDEEDHPQLKALKEAQGKPPFFPGGRLPEGMPRPPKWAGGQQQP